MLCVFLSLVLFFFFFKQKTAYEMRISDWSSDVCSSDLAPPIDRHRRGPRYVAIEDRRAHATRAVTLHPAVRREREAGKLLAEILDHVVALELAVDEHVEPDPLLPADRAFGLLAPEGIVRRPPDPKRVG